MKSMRYIVCIVFGLVLLGVASQSMAITQMQSANINQLISDIKKGKEKNQATLRARAKQVTSRVASNARIIEELVETAEGAGIPDLLGEGPAEELPEIIESSGKQVEETIIEPASGLKSKSSHQETLKVAPKVKQDQGKGFTSPIEVSPVEEVTSKPVSDSQTQLEVPATTKTAQEAKGGVEKHVPSSIGVSEKQLEAVLTKSSVSMPQPKQAGQATKKAGPVAKIELEALPIYNGLLIILDDSEQDFIGASSMALISAVTSQAGPILVSASLLSKMVQEVSIEELEQPSMLIEQFQKYATTALSSMAVVEIQKMQNIVIAAAQLSKALNSYWIVKKVGGSLFLLLPKTYLSNQGIQEDKARLVSSQTGLTTEEKNMGLKINHMKTVSIDEIQALNPMPQLKEAVYFVPALTNIFVTHEPNNKAISWSLYICGHGGIKKLVAGISIDDFRKFLSFLENDISTRLLYYSTCYGAGINSKTLYEDLENKIEKTYSFAIITQALTDNMIELYPRMELEEYNGQLQVKFNDSYKRFFSLITSDDVIVYDKAAELLTSPTDLASMPQIRFPGLQWFSVLDQDRVLPVGSIMAKSRTQPLNISNFKGSKKYPEAILLYANRVPFEIVIDGEKNLPHIISMLPGSAFHVIDTFSLEVSTNITKTLSDLVELFYKFVVQFLSLPTGEQTSKFFLISHVNFRSKNTEEDILQKFSDVVIRKTLLGNDVFYTFHFDNSQVFKIHWKGKNKVPMKPGEEQEYESALRMFEKVRLQEEKAFAEKKSDVETTPTHQLLTPKAISDIEKALFQNKGTYKR